MRHCRKLVSELSDKLDLWQNDWELSNMYMKLLFIVSAFPPTAKLCLSFGALWYPTFRGRHVCDALKGLPCTPHRFPSLADVSLQSPSVLHPALGPGSRVQVQGNGRGFTKHEVCAIISVPEPQQSGESTRGGRASTKVSSEQRGVGANGREIYSAEVLLDRDRSVGDG